VTIFRITEESSLSSTAADMSFGEKQLEMADRDSAVAFRVFASVESKKFQTAFHTRPTSEDEVSELTALRATNATPRTWTQLAQSKKSDFGGGDVSTTFRTQVVSLQY
jgi:hypothetical protein